MTAIAGPATGHLPTPVADIFFHLCRQWTGHMISAVAIVCKGPTCCGLRSWVPLKPILALRIKGSTTCRPSPAMQRNNGRVGAQASTGHGKADKKARDIPQGADFAWFYCGCWLVAGAFLPSLLACCFYKEVTMLFLHASTTGNMLKKLISTYAVTRWKEVVLSVHGCAGADPRCRATEALFCVLADRHCFCCNVVRPYA